MNKLTTDPLYTQMVAELHYRSKVSKFFFFVCVWKRLMLKLTMYLNKKYNKNSNTIKHCKL